jgi:sugar lactone lactonase YvrE
VTTFAGKPGIQGSDDGPREAATFNTPRDLAIGPDGTIYVSDAANQVIRKITTDGMVSTFAGQKGVSGSRDGPALEAQFSWPHGLCLDQAGNLFVADSSNHAIRKISPDGQVTTIAGQLAVSGSSDGVGSDALFKRPRGIAIDSSGNLYVSDQGNLTIRKISPAGAVTTIAGQAGQSGYVDGPGDQALFKYPWFLDIDKQGVVYIADLDNCVIRAVDKDGVVTTAAGIAGKHGFFDAPTDKALFGWPIGVATDAAGRVYMTDHYLVRQVVPGKDVQTLAGYSKIYSTPNSPPEGTDDGVGITARFNFLYGLAVGPTGDLYAADMNSHTIRRIEIHENVFRSEFPHFAAGGGVTSTIVLINPSRTEAATGRAILFDQEGQQAPNSIDFTIPPGGIRMLATPGSGGLVTGSVSVESNIPLAGTLLYWTPFGVAGVPVSVAGNRLMIAVENDPGTGVRTGAALANPGADSVQVNTYLRDEDGTLVSQASFQLPAHGHLAKFCDEFFDMSSLGQTRFIGSIEITASGAVCAVGLRVTARELATLPTYVE